MRQQHNKLVRDRIPDLIRNAGHDFDVAVLSEAEYRQALRHKLLEEAQEAIDATVDQLAGELADLLDVVDALLESYEISPEVVLLARDQKRAERGGFSQKVKLLWTEVHQAHS
ncbi:MAG: nucleoside triphosphate pyrophosphohydrolase [Oscillatoriales cyanobacterium RM2_1_1]|nr:nucleoside triphosphate pyrophosphohydrolase [Oscillatoriales cyanobacterium SM2_3_0]NJO46301.1 nucleoside triphosphate pyrophosphohydrolase [Oscillatoriales cyanobacterium RM2_1_1]